MATRTTKRMWIMLLAVVLLIGVLALFKFLQIRTLIASIPKPQPQVVSTVKATKLEWQPQFDAVGSLVAVRGVDVSSEIAGQVRELRFKSGQDVKAGDLLVQLNADSDIALQQSLQAAVDLAKGSLESSQPVEIHAKEGSLRANSMAVTDRGKHILFSGGVSVTFMPPAELATPPEAQ